MYDERLRKYRQAVQRVIQKQNSGSLTPKEADTMISGYRKIFNINPRDVERTC